MWNQSIQDQRHTEAGHNWLGKITPKAVLMGPVLIHGIEKCQGHLTPQNSFVKMFEEESDHKNVLL